MRCWIIATVVLVVSMWFVAPVYAEYFSPEAFDNDSDFYFQTGGRDEYGNPEVLHSGRPEVRGAIMLGDRDPRLVMVSFINILLGFLGMIALVIVLAGGFKMMTAGGNEDARASAQQTLWSGVVGLIIILSSFGIARFVISSLSQASGSF